MTHTPNKSVEELAEEYLVSCLPKEALSDVAFYKETIGKDLARIFIAGYAKCQEKLDAAEMVIEFYSETEEDDGGKLAREYLTGVGKK